MRLLIMCPVIWLAGNVMACDAIDGSDGSASSDVSTDGAAGDGATDSSPANEVGPDDTSEANADGDAVEALCLPQAPRDISKAGGVNVQSVAGPGTAAMWLCNVHFHDPREHAGTHACPEANVGGDAVCAPHDEDGGSHEEPAGVHPGDVVEVHWVYSSCEPADAAPPAPGQGLGACVCGGAQVLRVRAQVYVVDDAAGDEHIDAPPEGAVLASYVGSTTGTSYDNETCSSVGVNWEVATDCRPIRREALGTWCEANAFGEGHAHDARELVEDDAWLSPFTPATGQ